MGVVLLSVLMNSGNILLDKLVLSRRRLSLQNYIPLLFVFLFFVTAAFLPWAGSANLSLAFSQQYIFYFMLMVLLAIIWNIFYYQGLQKEKLIEFEMILLLTPLMTILLAGLFFPEELNWRVFTAAIIGAVALFLSHLRKHHFAFDKYAIHLILAAFLIAVETMVQKELLSVYSPALLYAVRTGILAIFFSIYYRPQIAKIDNTTYQLVFATAVCGTLSMVTRFYGFQVAGITFTTLVLLLVPIITSWLDAKFNKTPVKRRTVLAFIVILLCVIYATLAQNDLV